MVSLWGEKSGQSVLGHVHSSSVWRQSSCCPTLAQTGGSVLHTNVSIQAVKIRIRHPYLCHASCKRCPSCKHENVLWKIFSYAGPSVGTVGSEHSAALILPPFSQPPPREWMSVCVCVCVCVRVRTRERESCCLCYCRAALDSYIVWEMDANKFPLLLLLRTPVDKKKKWLIAITQFWDQCMNWRCS